MKTYSFITRILFFFILSNNLIASTFYIDPSIGTNAGDGSIANPWKTLQEVVERNLIESYKNAVPYDAANPKLTIKNGGAVIKGGDTLVLKNGMHGELLLQNYNNLKFITIIAAADHQPVLKKVLMQGCKNWKLEGLSISSEAYGEYINQKLVFLESHNWQGPVSNIIISDCTIFSAADPWTIADDWLSKSSDGIIIQGDSIQIINNSLQNINFGISAKGDYLEVIGNEIINFAGDGLRILGSYGLYENNIIKNCYVVNENHDDGIQSFTTGGLVVDNNTVRGNTIINNEDPNQALQGPLQGMGFFDGFYNNWIVENNLIIVNHWHGITFLGANNCKIINNTVLDPSPTVAPGASWIKIDQHKNGTASSGCIVKNNVSNSFIVVGEQSNNVSLSNFSDYQKHFKDYAASDFHLLSSSSLIDAADNEIAPETDHDGIARPQGIAADIGAFEFTDVTATIFIADKNPIIVFPNPFTDEINLAGDIDDYELTIFDAQARLITKYDQIEIPKTLDLSFLNTGIYFISLKHQSWPIAKTYQLIKQ